MSDQFDLGSMLAGAMELQQRFDEARASVEATEFTGSAGGGAVSITVTGNLRVLDVSISPDAVDPDDIGLLEDMVTAAFTDALARIDAMQQQVLGQFQMPDLSSLGGLDPDILGARNVIDVDEE